MAVSLKPALIPMKVYAESQARNDYLRTQIERSRAKFSYCKVSIRDACKYRDLLLRHRRATASDGPIGPIICLGSRNGREIDLFRTAFFGSPIRVRITAALQRNEPSFGSVYPWIESFGRSSWRTLQQTSVIGVEVNPMAARDDTWEGSFDQMPEEWTGRFGVAYSNSFDQSRDPEHTAKEWNRVIRPGGYIIFCYGTSTEPSLHDPVAALNLEDVRTMFPGDLTFYAHRGSANGYTEVILNLPAK